MPKHAARQVPSSHENEFLPTVTILTEASGKPQRKTHAIRPEDASAAATGFSWFWREEAAPDFETFAAILDRAAKNPCSIAIHGRVRDSHRDRKQIKRRIHPKQDDPTPALEDAGAGFLFFDVDKVPLPPALTWDAPEAIAAHLWQGITARLPALAGVRVWWQASGSAGVVGIEDGMPKERLGKMHFAVLLDAPLAALERRAIFRAAGADPALHSAAQILFVAEPAFVGIADPLPPNRRSGALDGPHDAADAALVLAQAESYATPLERHAARTAARTAAGGWQGIATPTDIDLPPVASTSPSGAAVLDDLCAQIRAVRDGRRNRALFVAGCRAGELVFEGLATPDDAFERLRAAGEMIAEERVEEPIRNGIARGIRTAWQKAEARRAWRESPSRLAELCGASAQAVAAGLIADMTPAKLPSRRHRDALELLASLTPETPDRTEKALAVALLLADVVPAQRDCDSIARALRSCAALDEVEVKAIMTRVEDAIEFRKDATLAGTLVTPAGRALCATVQEVASVRDAVVERDAITAVKAPMSSGKTQAVAAPWVEEAKRHGKVMAICHRKTLTKELGDRLNLARYDVEGADLRVGLAGLDDTKDDDTARGASICLPSITVGGWSAIRFDYVVIDEVSQVLRFLRSDECCRTAKAAPRDVYAALVAILRRAKGVLVLDAGLSDYELRFLSEQLERPVHLIVQNEPEKAGIEAVIHHTGVVAERAAERAAEEVQDGGNVWIASTTRADAERVHALLVADYGMDEDDVLVIHSGNVTHERVARFVSGEDTSADAESRRYRVVIASPVISSGISVEHRDDPHFTLGITIATDHGPTPADAAQQMRRVRYLTRHEIYMPRSKTKGRFDAVWSADARVAADLQIAELADVRATAKTFDDVVQHYTAEEERQRADFANGLVWYLQGMGWTLRKGKDDDAKKQRGMDAERKAAERERIAKVSKLLPIVTSEELRRLRFEAKTEDDDRLVRAARIARAWGKATLTAEDIKQYEDGVLERLTRLENLMAAVRPDLVPWVDPSRFRGDPDGNLGKLNHAAAQREIYRRLFDGFDLLADAPWMDDDAVQIIGSRAVELRVPMRRVRMITEKSYKTLEKIAKGRGKTHIDARTVVAILTAAGVEVSTVRARSVPDRAGPVYGERPDPSQKRLRALNLATLYDSLETCRRRAHPVDDLGTACEDQSAAQSARAEIETSARFTAPSPLTPLLSRFAEVWKHHPPTPLEPHWQSAAVFAPKRYEKVP